MARIVLTVGGYVLGNMLLPGLGGAIGGMLGGYVGGMVDQRLLIELARDAVGTCRILDHRPVDADRSHAGRHHAATISRT